MRILLLGGTGAMGRHLTQILASSQNEISVTSRKIRDNLKNVTFIQGDAHDEEFLYLVLRQDFDCIVDFMVYNTEEFKRRAEKMLSLTKQYIFISSARVYADSKAPIKEDSPRLLDICDDTEYLLTDEYALSKARQENILFESKHKNWTIIRPYITYSENRLQLGVMEKEEWLFLALYGNALFFSKDISSHLTTLTYGYDVARGISAIVGKENAFGEAFHITGNHCSIKWSEAFELYKEVLAKNGILPKVYELEICSRISNSDMKYQVIYDRYFDRVFDNSKIANFIDTSTFIKPLDGLAKSLDEFLKNKTFLYTSVSNGIKEAVRNYGVRIPVSKIKGSKQKLKYILVRLGLLR